MSGWIMPLLAGLTAGVAGSLGLGGGSVLVLWLTLVMDMPQKQAQGMNLLFFLPTAAVALITHAINGMVDWRAAGRLIAVGLVGTALGCAAAGFLPADMLRRAFAIFLLILGARELLSKND